MNEIMVHSIIQKKLLAVHVLLFSAASQGWKLVLGVVAAQVRKGQFRGGHIGGEHDVYGEGVGLG